jgi:hypothetical protein
MVHFSSKQATLSLALMTASMVGCWSDYVPTDVNSVTFTNEHVRSENGIVTTWELRLTCPDGENARFYTVHNDAIDGAMPVALVLHSSAFDYINNPIATDPLVGAHYAPSEEPRLTQTWGIEKTWATLGMTAGVDSTEVNTGAIPAALVDEGVVGFYPINCWGDLWENNETIINDLATEYFPRYGGTFAWWMIRLITEPSFAEAQGVEFDFEIDPSQLHLIGLGDGARGVVNIVNNDNTPDIAGVLVDSPVDDLTVWATDPAFSDEATGLQRIYNYSPGNEPYWNNYTLKALINQNHLNGARIALVYSDNDPRVPYPQSNFANMITAVEAHEEGLIINTGLPAHVHSNGNADIAREVVEFLFAE